jgi:hypothetical protein
MTMRVSLARLAGAIMDAEARHKENCLNGSTAMQVGSSQKTDNLLYAFAIASGTAIGGMHFRGLLEQARKDYQEAKKA